MSIDLLILLQGHAGLGCILGFYENELVSLDVLKDALQIQQENELWLS